MTKSITTLIQQRYSCRKYAAAPLAEETCQAVTRYIAQLPPGPFQKNNRFELVAAAHQERDALRRLGTYGFIKNPPAFIIGASEEGPLTLEDFGYRMEQIVLYATELGLGTCWLGGTFRRSPFAQKIMVRESEILPAVCSLGYPAQESRLANRAGQPVVSPRDRFGWEALFFDSQFGHPLAVEQCGAYQVPLEMVRIGPSASNKQPWRILRTGNQWNFYLQRTRLYREMALGRFTGIADMQRIDMGIAMCHFELAALDSGLDGKWEIAPPEIELPDHLTTYVVSWNSERG